MMSERHLVEAQLLGAAVGGSAAEVGAGEAGAAALFCVRLHDVDVVAVMRKAEASTEFLQLGLGKIGRKHAVHSVAGKLEGNRRIFFDFCEHRGQQHAVLAAAETDENAVAGLEHIEFDKGAP